MIKVAVITRTKDRPIFLKRALKSVASQKFEEYIHVVVNDGGDKKQVDAAVDSLNVDQRGRVKVFHREVSSNAPDTIFNESIDRVGSEYVVLHDDDDTWHPEFLSRSVKHLDDNASLGGVVVRTEKVTEELQDEEIATLKVQPWMPDLKVINLYRQCIDNQLTPIAFLFRRSAYEKAGKFDSTLPVVGDWEFGIRLLQKYDVDFLDPGFALAYYHHRKFNAHAQGNTSFAGNEKHRYYTNLVMNKYLREELSQGKIGVGYIMNKLKYDETTLANRFKKLLPTFMVDKIKNRIRQ